MKLEKILDQLNAFEKNSFLKVVTNIIDNTPKKSKQIEEILTDSEKDLKNVDNINVVKVFQLLEEEFADCIKKELVEVSSQLDILIDILIRDGNCIMSRDWFSKLYEDEVKSLKVKIKNFENELFNNKSEIPDRRIRDYKIYKECLKTAYYNDLIKNQDCKVTTDEQSILNTLSKNLGLSQEEIKLINYLIIEIKKQNIDSIINDLKNLGIIFYSKKTLNIFIADEIVRILRKIRGKEIADKYYRRVLKQLKEPQINLIARNHNINWKDSTYHKIKNIIKEGINFTDVLTDDIFKDGTKTLEKKAFINELIEKRLKVGYLKGVTIEDKINSLIEYFEQIDRDEKVGITMDGYEKLLNDIDNLMPDVKPIIKSEFELQEEEVLKSNYLIDYNIKPRDVLDLIPELELKTFCEKMSIIIRGDIVSNILKNYKDTENLYIENYVNIAYRDINELKNNSLNIKEADLGIKFEDVTKAILKKLGFIVDEKTRKLLNTSKNKIDIIITLEDEELIIIECKTAKESGYNKFSSVSRQIKSYIELANSKDYKVKKTLLIAPEFSEDFEKECREEFQLNLSLITAETLVKILNGFKNTKLKKFPYQLLMKDVLIKEDWILKAISK